MPAQIIRAKQLQPGDTFTRANVADYADLGDYTVISIDRLIGAVSLLLMSEHGQRGFVLLRNGDRVEIYSGTRR